MTGLAATGLFAITAISAANAAVERELLRVKIWATYKDVLAKHGQPTRIEIGAVESPIMGGGAAGGVQQARGGGLPGMMGMSAAPGAGMGAGKMTAMQSMPGASGGGASSGGGSMMMSQMANSRRASQMGGTGSMMGGGNAMAQMMGMGGRGGGGRMGPPGGGGDGGGLGAPMGARGGMAMGVGGAASSDDEGEVTWIYEKGPLTYMFLFNKDGRVIQISEYGYSSPFGTEHGVRLGDQIGKIYGVYGWSAQTTKVGNQLTLDYSNGQHVAFQLVNEGRGAKVVGIVVALAEKTHIPTGGPGAGAGMYGAPGMSSGGLPGFGGLPGAGKGGAGAGASD
jgi:hypothetical protein